MAKKTAILTLAFYIIGPLPLIAVIGLYNPTYYGGYGLVPLVTSVTAYTWLMLFLMMGTKQSVPPSSHSLWFQAFIAAAGIILILSHKLFLENVFQADMRTLLGNITLLIIIVITVFCLVFMTDKLKALRRMRLRVLNMKIRGYDAKAVLYHVAYAAAVIVFVHVMLSRTASNPWAAALLTLYFAAASACFFYNRRRYVATKKRAAGNEEDPAAVPSGPHASADRCPARRITVTRILPIFAAVAMLFCAGILVKVLQIIDKMNSQTVNVPQPSQAEGADTTQSAAALDHALVIITFDDANESDYAVAYPILKKYGIKGTSFINPYFPDNHIQHKLSWNEIKQMAADGWEFGDHTYAHIALGSATEDQIKRSMALVNNAFLRNGLDIPETIAYPYGDLSQQVIDIVKPYRKQGRLAAVEDDIVNLNKIDPYQIQCVSADIQTLSALKSKELLVDKACDEKTVIVLRAHCLFRNQLNDMGNQPVQANAMLFEQLVKYCVNKGCTFTTMDGFLSLYASNETTSN